MRVIVLDKVRYSGMHMKRFPLPVVLGALFVIAAAAYIVYISTSTTKDVPQVLVPPTQTAPTTSTSQTGNETAPVVSTTSTVVVGPSNDFRFVRNKQFALAAIDTKETESWKAYTDGTRGTLEAKVTIPKSFQPKTNFSEATFTVGSSSDRSAIAACLQNAGGNTTATSNVTLNGVPFTIITMGDAGAGNFYETTSYRAVHDGKCYAIEYTIHSTNIGNYSPDQGIVEYDRDAVVAEMERMVRSFEFTP